MVTNMNEAENYFSEEQQEEPPKQSGEDFSFLEGICGKCLDTGFVHTTKKVDGQEILGIAYTTFSNDANGNPVKKLMVCNHNKETINC